MAHETGYVKMADSGRGASMEQENLENHTPKLPLHPDTHEVTHPQVQGCLNAGEAAKEDDNNDNTRHVFDTDWSKGTENVARPLMSGLSNEDLWILVRRFDQQIFYLKEIPLPETGSLDFNLSDEADFSANKLRSQVERLYMGVLLGLVGCIKHISRLRSWNEPRRTGVLCISYFLAWYFNILVLFLTVTSMAMIISPKFRTMLVPPAPTSMVDWVTGELLKPPAGVLGSTDALTGAPENLKGMAVEAEANNFVTGVVGATVNTLTAQDPKAEPENQKGETHPFDSLPQPNEATTIIAVVKDKATGVIDPSQDKTKKPVETIMWSKMLPLLQLLYTVSDTWERLANALDPSPPFSQNAHRLQLAGLLVPIVITSTFVSPNALAKAGTFVLGVLLFGQPLLAQAYQWLDRVYPGWTKQLRPENNVFKGIPNNAQLTIALLRFGEAQGTPLPPSPHLAKTISEEPTKLEPSILDAAGADSPLGATQEAIENAAAPDASILEDTGGPNCEVQATGGRKTSRLINFVKGSAKVGIQAALTLDKVRAKAGRGSALNRIGAIAPKDKSNLNAGPVEFKARFEGRPGLLRINADGVVAFDQEWFVRVNDITELKKHAGLGMKSKLAAGWAMDRDVFDGIEIKDRAGKSYVLSSVPFRDRLFNRLCAIGGQNWEVW